MINLVMLPGLDGIGVMHEEFFTALGPDYHIKAVHYSNQAGMGYAELEILARAVLPEHGPFLLFGESFSGPLAIRLAHAFPERTLGLILCVSFVRNPHPRLAWLRPLLRILPLAGAPLVFMSRLLFGKRVTANIGQSLNSVLSRISPATLRARLRAILSVDTSREFTELKIPMLYLRAKHDRLVPHRASELAASLNPRLRIVELESSHLLLQTHPQEAARAVAQYVQQLQNTSSPTTAEPASITMDATT